MGRCAFLWLVWIVQPCVIFAVGFICWRLTLLAKPPVDALLWMLGVVFWLLAVVMTWLLWPPGLQRKDGER